MKTRVFIIATLAVVFVMQKGFSQDEKSPTQIKHEQMQANTMWLANQFDPPAKASVYLYDVPMGVDGKISGKRGALSGYDCLMIATQYALANNNDASIKWLCAGQAHNPAVIEQYLSEPSYVTEFIKRKYKAEALKHAGGGPTFIGLPAIAKKGLYDGVFGGSHESNSPPKE